MRVSKLVSAATLLCVWLTCEANTIGSATTAASRVSEEGVAEGRRQAIPQPEDGQDLRDARWGFGCNHHNIVQCGETATLMPGDVLEFQSMYYPFYYPNHHLCTWTFKTCDPNDILAVDCDTFYVEYYYDGVIFIEPTAPAGMEILANISGNLGCFMTTTMTGLLEVTFVSDYIVSLPGFHCSVYIIECESRISRAQFVGGVEAPQDKYSWNLPISDDQDTFVCSGSLVSPTHVLTAAHCVNPDKQYRVLVGSRNISDAADGTYVEVSKVTIHKDYDSATRKNDIALLELPDEQSNVESVCMSETETGDAGNNANVVITGWESNGGLMEVEVQLVDPHECRNIYKDSFSVNDQMMCAGTEDKGICQDDGGAPLVDADSVLIGIATHTEECGNTQYRGVFTKVSAYTEWVKEQGVSQDTCFKS